MNDRQDQATASAMNVAEVWAAAERRGDAGELDRLLAPDFTAVGPRGFVLSRAQWIERFLSGDLHYESLDWQDVSARAYGTAAIVIGRQKLAGFYRGQPLHGEFRASLMLVQLRGDWRLAGLQLSPIVEG